MNAKVKRQDTEKAQQLRAIGASHAQISRSLGLSVSTVRRILAPNYSTPAYSLATLLADAYKEAGITR